MQDDGMDTARRDLAVCRAQAEADPADQALQRDLALALERLAHHHILNRDPGAAWPLLEEAVGHRQTLLRDGPKDSAPYELASACIQAIFAAPDENAARHMYGMAAEALNPLVAAGVDSPRLTKMVEGLARIGTGLS